METQERKINSYLRNHLIPQLIGIFGEKCGPNDAEYTLSYPQGAFFLSDLFFLNIRFPNQEKRLLVKMPTDNPAKRSPQNYTQLFANEILFYQKLAINESADYAQCYLCGSDPVFGNVIVLENLCQRNFFVCPAKMDVPLEYIIAGMRSIARFHGMTYTLKEQKPEKFNQIRKEIINSRYGGTADINLKKAVNLRAERVTKHLRNNGHDIQFTNKIAKLFENCFDAVLIKSSRPVEPLATIVHGDCTINNIMFRKLGNKEANSMQALLVDFGLLMYSSPMTDFATFLYMSCSVKDIKEQTWTLLKAYHDCLSEYMKDQGIWNPNKYSYDAFWKDFKRCAIFGYTVAVFFRAMMVEFNKDNDILQKNTIETLQLFNLTGGGELLSNELVDMLMHMRENGLLDGWI